MTKNSILEQVWITTAEAGKLRHQKAHAFCQWAKRWNERPDTVRKILRQHGLVERNSLMAAMDEAARLNDAPHQGIRQAYADLHANHRTGGRRRNSVIQTVQKGVKP